MKFNQGFMLCELMIALACMVMVGALGCTLLPLLYRIPLDLELHHLKATCQYLQCKARATNTDQILQCNSALHGYQYEGCTVPLVDQVRFGMVPGLLGPPSSAKSPVRKPITFHNEKIIFSGKGGLDSGSIYCIDATGAYQGAVTVGVGEGGYIRVYRYLGNRWHLWSTHNKVEIHVAD